MIGHFLLSLTPEQEDRVLTNMFSPIAHLPIGHCARCLVLTALGREKGASATGLTRAEDFDNRRGDACDYSPGWRYEYACDRFGAPRVNAAIRNRILSNRARRALSGVGVHERSIDMTKYPEVIDLAKYANVSDAEVARDIADTEREIAQYRELREAEARIARAHPSQAERRMAAFKSGARVGQIAEREEFVAFLRRIQAARASGVGQEVPQ